MLTYLTSWANDCDDSKLRYAESPTKIVNYRFGWSGLLAHKAAAWRGRIDPFFWTHFPAEQEIAEAAITARAARDAGLQQVIWFRIEDALKWVSLNDERLYSHARPTRRLQFRGALGHPVSRSLNPALLTLDQCLADNRARIPIE